MLAKACCLFVQKCARWEEGNEESYLVKCRLLGEMPHFFFFNCFSCSLQWFHFIIRRGGGNPEYVSCWDITISRLALVASQHGTHYSSFVNFISTLYLHLQDIFISVVMDINSWHKNTEWKELVECKVIASF